MPILTARELATALMEHPDAQVRILDGFNSSGEARIVNFGPTLRVIKKRANNTNLRKIPHIPEWNVEHRRDENLNNVKLLLIGYGCY